MCDVRCLAVINYVRDSNPFTYSESMNKFLWVRLNPRYLQRAVCNCLFLEWSVISDTFPQFLLTSSLTEYLFVQLPPLDTVGILGSALWPLLCYGRFMPALVSCQYCFPAFAPPTPPRPTLVTEVQGFVSWLSSHTLKKHPVYAIAECQPRGQPAGFPFTWVLVSTSVNILRTDLLATSARRGVDVEVAIDQYVLLSLSLSAVLCISLRFFFNQLQGILSRRKGIYKANSIPGRIFRSFTF